MNSAADDDGIRAALLLSRAWMERGNLAAAETSLQRGLLTSPQHGELQRQLAHVHFLQGRRRDAVEDLAAACRSRPDDAGLARELEWMKQLAGLPPEPVAIPDHLGGRLRFQRAYDGSHHRSGWGYGLAALQRLHHSAGVRFEHFVEDLFAWQLPREGVRTDRELIAALREPRYETRLTSEERGLVPIHEPWVGVVHNPPGMPAWFHGEESPQAITVKSAWRASLPSCVGLFALSEYAAQWWRQATGKPVSVVFLPNEKPRRCFDFDRFVANPDKLIVQVGWWLRRLGAIERLPLGVGNALGYRKLRLVPHFADGSAAHVEALRRLDVEHAGAAAEPYAANTSERMHVANEAYDELLASHLVFVDLYDASANNAVVECLVRATPLLVNRLPAVEEYLGSDYPLYFRDLDHAAAMALDLGRLRAAHEYLRQWPLRERMDAEHFVRAVEASEVYGLL